MKRSIVLARAGTVAVVAAFLPAALQRTNPGLVVAVGALAVLVTAGAAIWLAPTEPMSRAIALALCAPMLIAAAGNGATATALTRAFADAAAPLVLALAGVSLMRRRTAITVATVGGLVAGPARMLIYDPFLDPACQACGHVGVAVWPHPELAQTVQTVGLGLVLIGVAWELIRGDRAIVGVGVCITMFALDRSGQAALVLCCGYATAVWTTRSWATWRRRQALRHLLTLHEHEGGLTDILRQTMRDPGLTVTFPTTDGGDFVDVAGNPASPRPEQMTTDLFIGGELLARVHHGARTAVPDLDAALDPVAGLILQNERSTAQLAARVHELTRARTNIVRVGLGQRLSIERDLHDGVQQQLLALGLDIRLAIGSLPDDSPDRASLEEALALVHECVDGVRAISTGVSPPLLATRGLRPAVDALVRRHGTPVDIGGLPAGRLPPDVERAAYAVVAEALARGATSLRAIEQDGLLTVHAAGAVEGADGVLPDLVAALGGRIRLGSSIEAVIPCES